MAIEGEFDITVDDKDVESISTVGDVVNYIKNKMQ
jgi:acyl carrier protein